MCAISDKMTSMVQDNNKKRLGNREALKILLRFIVLVLVVLEKTFCSLTSQLLKIFSSISDYPYQSIVMAFLFISMAILKYFWACAAILNPEKQPTSFDRTNGFPAK